MKKGLYLIFLTFIVNNTYACQEVEIVENIDKINFELNILNLQGNKREIERISESIPQSFYKNYILGISYLDGKNKIKNLQKSENYLLKSSEFCFSPAHYSLGYLYYLKGDLVEAKKWFISAKELGDNLAAHQLGLMYKNEKNSEKMLENLSFSENNDFTPSITEFGVQYYDGVLLNRDFNKAFIYFERAALRNDPLAQNNLGWMYEHGECTEKDINKAKYWYQLAAAQGHIKDINNLKLLNFKK